MKKIKLSLAALTLVLAITGTTMANRVHKKDDRCSVIDPQYEICIGGVIYCCWEEISGDLKFYNP